MSFSIINQQMLLPAATLSSRLHSSPLFSATRATICTPYATSVLCGSFALQSGKFNCTVRRLSCYAASKKSDADHDSNPRLDPKLKPKGKSRRRTSKESDNEGDNSKISFPGMIPKKPRRGRRSEAAAVEDFVRNSLERTLSSIKKQNPEILDNMENFMKEKVDSSKDAEDDSSDDDSSDDDSDENEASASGQKKMVIEEEDPNWPLDADIGWGIKASEYFEQHPIKNVVGEDGTEIDWEGEVDNGLVKEINCLEWESFAFHPSPLIVLVFERYNRASHNWRVLKELEKAAEVYWKAKDRLPPRTVKVDINIERDLAYALKVRECPAILFLRGNKILYREKDIRSADELVQMIAHFYYNAKKPSCIKDEALS